MGDSRDNFKALVQQQFGRTAEKYVASQTHAKGKDLELAIKMLGPQPAWTVLDIATGGGHMAKAVASSVAHVFATDLTEEMLSSARRHLTDAGLRNVFYVRADAEALPFLEASFDAVSCRIAAHHFPAPDKFVQSVARVLQPGGLFLFIDNIAPEDKDLADFLNTFERMRDESHVECLSVSQWTSLFEQYGLQSLGTTTLQSEHDFQTWIERMALSTEQVMAVEKYMLSASETMKSHYGIEVRDGHVARLKLEKWVALFRK